MIECPPAVERVPWDCVHLECLSSDEVGSLSTKSHMGVCWGFVDLEGCNLRINDVLIVQCLHNADCVVCRLALIDRTEADDAIDSVKAFSSCDLEEREVVRTLGYLTGWCQADSVFDICSSQISGAILKKVLGVVQGHSCGGSRFVVDVCVTAFVAVGRCRGDSATAGVVDVTGVAILAWVSEPDWTGVREVHLVLELGG